MKQRTIAARLPADLAAWLTSKAARDGVLLSDVVRDAVSRLADEEYIAAEFGASRAWRIPPLYQRLQQPDTVYGHRCPHCGAVWPMLFTVDLAVYGGVLDSELFEVCRGAVANETAAGDFPVIYRRCRYCGAHHDGRVDINPLDTL